MELRRGPWMLEEDSLLIHYIARHGEGRWNLLARCSGLKRTGKSCRLRWLNYLKPDVKRGNLSPEEQFLILELHSKWGNRWSRIAQYLPGRTDNEIKNYWRTRVQKHARQLKIDANSTMFRDAVRCYWMPKLLEKMASNTSSSIQSCHPNSNTQPIPAQPQHFNPSPQDYIDPSSTHSSSDNYNCVEFAQNAPCTFGSTSTSVSLVHDMHNGYNLDGLDLASASNMSTIDYSSPSDCIEDGSNWVDGLWSMDEMWHGRKPHEWSSMIL